MAPRILVADDDRQLQLLLKVLLTRAGFDVDFASSGNEALTKTRRDNYDAVMLDLIFPDLNGMDILAALQKEKPHAMRKIIVITGAAHSIIEKIDTSRIHALLRKPFDIHEVIRLTVECVHEA
ncbi:MAG TPA: response regulator [Thermoanaerobaculia bacterium]|nr:response regulator [Thermoanaerobaculia bacterium]